MSKEVFDRGMEVRKKVLGAEFVEKSFASADESRSRTARRCLPRCRRWKSGDERLPHTRRRPGRSFAAARLYL
ncbi:MAG: hypothetical protein WDM84_03660 [Bauldia sp.]